MRLVIGSGTIRAEATIGSLWRAEAPYSSLAELADAIARLAAEAPRNGTRPRVAVLLERPLVQLRSLAELPPVKSKDLAALVAAQSGRFFRKNGGALATDATWKAPGVARAGATEESLLEAIVAGARGAGLVLETIAPVGAPELCLLPASERIGRRRAELVSLRRLAICAGAAWLAAGAIFAARLMLERRAIERELVRLQEPLKAELAARRELRSAEATVLTMRYAMAERREAATIFRGVAVALPDSVVLGSLARSADGSGALSGWASDAAGVVAALVRTQAVTNPRLDGPAVKETVAGREWQRFTIVFGGQK